MIEISAPLQGLVTKLQLVGDTLHEARLHYDTIEEVIKAVDNKKCGFRLEHSEESYTQQNDANPILREIGVDEELVRNERYVHKSRIRIKGKGYKDIKIDGNSNFRDGSSNPGWTVYTSTTDRAGKIIAAAIYMPTAHKMFLADENGAYVYKLLPNQQPVMESLQVSENLKEPCTGEWGSWHRIAYSPLKMAYSTIVRENLGGSVRETGMKQLPLVWVATGER